MNWPALSAVIHFPHPLLAACWAHLPQKCRRWRSTSGTFCWYLNLKRQRNFFFSTLSMATLFHTAVCQQVHPLSSFTHHNYCSLSTRPSPLIFHTQLLQSVSRSNPSHLSHTTTTAVCQHVHPLSSFTHHNYCSLSTHPSPLIFHTPQLLQSVNTSIPSHLSHTTTTAVCQQVHPLSSFTHHNYFSLSTGPSPLIFHTPQLLQSVNRPNPSHLCHKWVCLAGHLGQDRIQVCPTLSSTHSIHF